MDKNEVITLSSDDESDFKHRFEHLNTTTTIKPELKNLQDILKSCLVNTKNISLDHNKSITIQSKRHSVQIVKVPKIPPKKCKLQSPEVVDLEDCSEKLTENGHIQFCNSSKRSFESSEKKINSKLDFIDIEDIPKKNDFCVNDKNTNSDVMIQNPNKDLKQKNVIRNKENSDNVVNDCAKSEDQIQVKAQKEINFEGPDPNLKLFTEFVEFCGSLEEIPNDRARLTKKLMKRYGEAECHYIKSEEFRNVIQKCKNKVNKDNLYLIAKEITDELSYRKEIEICTGESKLSEKKCQSDQKMLEDSEKEFTQTITKQSKKRTRIINRVIKKLNKLGIKIRELEIKEVDLSDEEESSYIKLQRYRERFCQIYQKLCKYTNEVFDADRAFDRKICFTESKYPKINKCIEYWLNKTKRFPDFSDVMKLLESQSTFLGLPSNKDSIRSIAIEIFQQVGAMLQRRRKYDLWDSFCGFLDEGEDPALTDPTLDQVLKKNFEVRVKKEQDIFQHYVELQENEKLEPEEISDEEANRSPVDSGNEDEKEIEDIENSINRRLDIAIEKEAEENGNEERNNARNKGEPNAAIESDNSNSKTKESKNNYRNCKSLKWRLENGLKSKSESTNSENYNTVTENMKDKIKTNGKSTKMQTKGGDDDSDLELITVEDVKTYAILPGKTFDGFKSLKRGWCSDKPHPKKAKYGNNECDVFELDCENESPDKKNDVFEVRCCQIFADNVFENLECEKKKDWEKRKVFRDLTNVNRLMELHGRKRKMSGLFSPSFFHRSFCEYEKPSWKKRFKVSFRLVGSKGVKCALNQDDKSQKTVSSDSGGDLDEKDIQNNTEGGGDDEGGEFYSGGGNGNEEDNNEDENKKNGRDKDEHEEEEEEEENENEKEDDNIEHSFQKTEPDSERTTLEFEKTVEEVLKRSEKKEEDSSVKYKAEEKQEIVEESLSSTEIECGVIENSKNEKEEDVEVLNVEAEEKDNERPGKEKVKEVKNFEYRKEPVEVELEKESSSDNKQDTNGAATASKIAPEEIINGEDSCIIVEDKHKPTPRCTKFGRRKRESVEIKQTPIWKALRMETTTQKSPKRNTPSTSDEERVKRFLLHSPSSISITPPRKLTLSKPPSEAAMQALATLRNLKGISATIVRGGKPKSEDDVVVIGVSHSRHAERKAPVPPKPKRNDLPVISSVQSIDTTTPKIVTVQGNVSGFENSWPELSNNSQCNSSSIRISNVWGSLPNNFIPNEVPGCSFRQSNSGSSSAVKKKGTKKTVEYVVLD